MAGGRSDDRTQRDYRPAFLAYLSRRDERTRTAGYDLGRQAVVRGASLLELVAAHHVTLLEVLPDAADPDDAASMCTAASEFLTEVLASFAMASAALPDLQEQLRQTDEHLRSTAQELADLRGRLSDRTSPEGS